MVIEMVSKDLLLEVDALLEEFDFDSREAFVEAAVHRLVAHYHQLMHPIAINVNK